MSKIIKARGLPWAATQAEVVEFFNTSTVVGGEEGVHVVMSYEGRPSGTVYVEVESQDDVSAALSKDREKMGRRYIEVFEASKDEMDRDLSKGNAAGKGGRPGGAEDDGVVKLRGLPFGATKSDVEDFFTGMEIEDNGVLMLSDFQGRPKGECFVQFTTADSAVKALEKNKASMGHRYIEVFPASMDEAKMAQQNMSFPVRGGMGGRPGGPMRGGGMGRPGPYDRMGYGGPRGGYGGGGGGMRGGYGGGAGGYGGGGYGGGGYGGGRASGVTIKVRGLPFRVSENEIAEWFSSVADPVDIQIRYNHEGRPSGDAFVTFGSEGDAKKAMQKNKQNMQHRYIELFMEG